MSDQIHWEDMMRKKPSTVKDPSLSKLEHVALEIFKARITSSHSHVSTINCIDSVMLAKTLLDQCKGDE